MSTPIRLLGFAFAGADLLVELDDRWRATFAAGAAPTPGSDVGALVALPLAELFTPCSADHLAAVLGGLKAGKRLEPVEARMRAGGDLCRRVAVRAIMLPDLSPSISCAITFLGEPEAAEELGIADTDGFTVRAQAELTRSHNAGAPLSLALVHLAGLDSEAPQAPALVREIEALLQRASVGGATAARLADQRYALLREPGASPEDLRASIGDIARRHDQAVEPVVSVTGVASDIDPMASLRALRFTLDSFLQGKAASDGALSMTFTGAVMRTLSDAADFRAMVARREFALCYQPIVKLASGKLSHFEVLARFAPETSPASVIRMAEELALITDFDMAVAERAVRSLREHAREDLRLAVNMSGASLTADRFMETLLRMTADDLALRRRLTVEVTESAALDDTAAANTRLQALRTAGFRVAIDDFGAGAASFDYLRSLSVDAVKIDGRFVREAAEDARSRKMIAHLVGLCRSLKLETVAEMIETEETAALMRQLGVDCGQGWLFGRPGPEPRLAVEAALPARRRGMAESWG